MKKLHISEKICRRFSTLGEFYFLQCYQTIRRTNSWKDMVCSSMVSSKIVSIFKAHPCLTRGLFIELGLFMLIYSIGLSFHLIVEQRGAKSFKM